MLPLPTTEVLEEGEEAAAVMEQRTEIEPANLFVRLKIFEMHCPVPGLYFLMLDHVGQEPVGHYSLD